jgi:AcrR family transcriptional regulator
MAERTSKSRAARPLGRPPATDSAATRRRILDTARASFARLGYEATTNRSLAEDAGITSGALYHYFGSKLDLYVAVHEDVQTIIYDRFNRAVATAGTFIGKLEAVLDVAHVMNEEDPTLAQFVGAVRVDVRRHPELVEPMRPPTAQRARFFTNLVDVGVQTGEIDPADRPLVDAFLTTILIGLTDAVSGNQTLHAQAVDGIKALLAGKLLHPPG